MNNAGERVRYVRCQLKMTQKRFGETLGIKQNTVALIEAGRRGVSKQSLILLERLYGVRPEWIKSGEGETCKDGWKRSQADTEVLSTLSPTQIICTEEIAGFNEAQMKKLIKAMSCICENKDIKKLADRYPVDDFEADILKSAANKLNKV